MTVYRLFSRLSKFTARLPHVYRTFTERLQHFTSLYRIFTALYRPHRYENPSGKLRHRDLLAWLRDTELPIHYLSHHKFPSLLSNNVSVIFAGGPYLYFLKFCAFAKLLSYVYITDLRLIPNLNDHILILFGTPRAAPSLLG